MKIAKSCFVFFVCIVIIFKTQNKKIGCKTQIVEIEPTFCVLQKQNRVSKQGTKKAPIYLKNSFKIGGTCIAMWYSGSL